MTVDGYLSVGAVADQIGCRPRDISRALYDRALRHDLCPVEGNKRWIPLTYVDEVARVMRRRGVVRSLTTNSLNPAGTVATQAPENTTHG